MPADGNPSITATLVVTVGGIITSLFVLIGVLYTARRGGGDKGNSAVSSLAAVVVERDHIIDEQAARIHVLETALRLVDPTNTALP